MKLQYVIAFLLASCSTALPALDRESSALVRRKLVSDFHGALIDFDHSQFEKRRGGSGGGGGGRGGGGGGGSSGGSSSGSRGGGSSGSSGSSGSRGGGSSGSSGSSGSRGGGSSGSSSSGSTRGSGITTVSPMMPGGLYYGGAAIPFAAGLATAFGLTAILLLASSVTTHYPGYWGHGSNPQVYDYAYSFDTGNGTNVGVDCYCIKDMPCSCEQQNATSYSTYFANLPSNITRFERENATSVHWYINGTLPASKDFSDGSSASMGAAGMLTPSNVLYVALATTVYYLL